MESSFIRYILTMASTFILIVALGISAAAGAYNDTPEAVAISAVYNYGHFVQDDMRFGEEQLMVAKSGILGDGYRWPNAQVFVQFDPKFTNDEKNTIIYGMKDIMEKTCIRFYYRQSSNKDYISIVRGARDSGCWSYVGKQGGKQDLNLQANGCIHKGVAAHEFIHALGFFHEQSRPDRDSYVRIQYENIESGYAYAFDKYDENQVSTFNVEYDYKSIMHYEQRAFSKNGQPTIVPSRNGVSGRDLGQTDSLTEKDAQKIKNMYRC